jgi:hypothetical protein
MKRFAKMLGVTCVAALALSAMATAGASAAQFTWSSTGPITGTSTGLQTFSAGGGSSVTCTHAHTHGTVKKIADTEQHVTVTYSGCTAHTFLGPAAATVTPATYNLTANGEVHVLNTIVIHVPAFGCTTNVAPQTLKSVSYTNKAGGKIEQHSNVTGIVSTSIFPCPSGTNGTYSGSNLLERPGGTLTFHP